MHSCEKLAQTAHPLRQSFSISAYATVHQACECSPHQYKGPYELSDQTSEGVDQLEARGGPGLVAVGGRALASQLEGGRTRQLWHIVGFVVLRLYHWV